MPAPKSRLREEKNPFAPVDTAKIICKKVLDICLRMPKRYTYLCLKETYTEARLVRRYAKAANSVFPTKASEAQIRREYWIKARAFLQSLKDGIDDFLDIPNTFTYRDERTGKTKGVGVEELQEISDLIIKEQALLTNQLEIEQERYKNLQ